MGTVNCSPVIGFVSVSSASVTKASAGGGIIQSGRGPGVTSTAGTYGSGAVPAGHALPFTHSYP